MCVVKLSWMTMTSSCLHSTQPAAATWPVRTCTVLPGQVWHTACIALGL